MTDAEAKEADAAFQKARPDALLRGKNTCVFCGFRDKAMEVHHDNDLHHDNRPDNLKVACPICHSVCHVGQVAVSKHGYFVYLPGLPQADFNQLLRTIYYVLETGKPEQKQEAKELLDQFRLNAAQVAEAWGTSKLIDFAEAMLRLGSADYKSKREPLLSHLLLIFEPERFEKYTQSWADTAYKKLPIDTWSYLFEQITKRGDNDGGIGG